MDLNLGHSLMEHFPNDSGETIFRQLFGYRSSDSENDEDEKGCMKISAEVIDKPVAREIISYISSELEITVILNERKALGIAHQLWPAAIFLCDYIEKHPDFFLQCNPVAEIVELGAGIGLCGTFLSLLIGKKFPSLKARIIMTDLPEAVDALVENISLNQLQDYPHIITSAQVFCWGDELQYELCRKIFASPPIVIAADCIYWTSLYEPFLRSVYSFCNDGSTVILAHVKRWKKDSIFFAMCRKKGLTVTVLHESIDQVADDFTKILKKQIKRIYKITKLHEC